MTIIKNIHLLTDIVSPGDVEKMEYAAKQHKQFSNIHFKVIEVTPKSVVFKVEQGKSSAGNYQTAKRLIEIAHETFDRFFPDRKLQAGPVVYKVPAPNKVDSAWIVDKMRQTDTRLKTIADETGIDYTRLSALVNGERPLSQSMKALFWFYFLTKE